MTDELLINDGQARAAAWRDAVVAGARGEPTERLLARLQTSTPEGLTWQALAVDVPTGAATERALRSRPDLPVAGWLDGDTNAVRSTDGLPVTDALTARLVGVDFAPAAAGGDNALIVGLGETVGEAGADAVLDLAVALAAGAALVQERLEAGDTLDALARRTRLRFAIGRTVWTEVARLRAARRCWARLLRVVAQAHGVDDAVANTPVAIDALQARRCMTLVDPKGNILRGTTAAFAAVIGGADRVCVRPYDARDGRGGSPLGRRIAENTLRVLHFESSLDAALDPAAGSFALETLTDGIARAAWQLLGEIDADGGVLVSLRRGVARQRLLEARAALRREIATRRRPITGVSTTPQLLDEPSALLAARASEPSTPAGHDAALAFFDEAEDWHALRARSDARLATDGQRPTCLLVLFGQGAAATARADWTRHVLHAAGVATVDWRPAEGPPSGDGLALACLCGPDDLRAGFVQDHGAALRGAGCSALVVAGRPTDGESTDTAMGLPVVSWLRVGADLVEAGERVQQAASGGAS